VGSRQPRGNPHFAATSNGGPPPYAYAWWRARGHLGQCHPLGTRHHRANGLMGKEQSVILGKANGAASSAAAETLVAEGPCPVVLLRPDDGVIAASVRVGAVWALLGKGTLSGDHGNPSQPRPPARRSPTTRFPYPVPRAARFKRSRWCRSVRGAVSLLRPGPATVNSSLPTQSAPSAMKSSRETRSPPPRNTPCRRRVDVSIGARRWKSSRSQRSTGTRTASRLRSLYLVGLADTPGADGHIFWAPRLLAEATSY